MNKSRNFKEEIFNEGIEKGKREEARRKDHKLIVMLKKNGFKLDDILSKFDDFDLSEDEIKEIYNNN
ncbi:hypothetical protein QJL30_10225 [Clostridioides difficile]|nr:hypothetical protein [Clostridioides difficile]MDI3004316.1 hypothetical protein [Clostridioides difficile]